ncbi:MAG: 6-bladed beta-propeller [Gemmatimonadota bacterium]
MERPRYAGRLQTRSISAIVRRVIAPLSVAGTLAAPSDAVGQRGWRLVIDTRVDVEAGPAEPVGELRDFTVANDGRIVILDYKSQVLHVFGRDGRFERTASRKGSGPGELRSANGLAAAPDGTIWVNDPDNNRLSIFASDGRFIRHISHDARAFGYRWDGTFDGRGRLVARVYVPAAGRGTYVLQRRRLDGSIVDSLPLPRDPPAPAAAPPFWQATFTSGGMSGMYPFMQSVAPAFDQQGSVWVSTGQDYALARLNLETGDTAARAGRSVPAERVAPAARRVAIESIRKRLTNATRTDFDESRVPEVHPFVKAAAVDRSGRLWVARGTSDTTRALFDLFDRNGRFLGSATLDQRIDVGRLVFTAERLFAIALGEDDLPSIIGARMVPR